MIRAAALLLAGSLAIAADAALPADGDFVAGLDAYERAAAADALGRGEDAGRLLREARLRLDAAIAGYRAVLATDSGRDQVQRRLGEALTVGKPCCGQRSLWEAYGVRPAPP